VLEQIDPGEYDRRIERITEIFSSMMVTVEDLTGKRCPYKNRLDQCTANFGCRNQRKPLASGELKQCGGDDKLDYRGAWETD